MVLKSTLYFFITGLLSCWCMSACTLFAQETVPVKYGKIGSADFATKIYPIDTAANAVILADVGEASIIANDRGWFSIEHKRYRRVHILNKNGYDLADVAISLYLDGNDQERLVSVKGNTYNMVHDQIETTAFDNDQLFTDKPARHQIIKKFTMPNVKEGSIIEYEYRTISDFLFNLPSWSFQGTVPRLWSEYTTNIPQFMEYVFLAQGYHPFYINDKKTKATTYIIRDNAEAYSVGSTQVSALLLINHWVMKDVPPLKEEPYTSSLGNHISYIEFQLSGYGEPIVPKKFMSTWPETCKIMLEDEDFGADLAKENRWVSDYIGDLAQSNEEPLIRAQKIYNYVRDNFTCTQQGGVYLSQPGLRNVARLKGGKTSDINLMLIAMFRYAGISAAPVILSTRSNGYAHSIYPLMNKYNYVVASAEIDGKTYLLDASNAQLPFGMLNSECYNGIARKINDKGDPVKLMADSLSERKMVNIQILTDDKGALSGEMTTWPGKYESMRVRAQLKADGIDGFKKEAARNLGTAMSLQDVNVQGYTTPDSSVTLRLKYNFNNDNEDMIYVQPLQHETTKENPFKSASRTFPVEMSYCLDEMINVSMAVPQGYEVEELPKSSRVNLDEDGTCYFHYRVQRTDNMIQISSRIVFKRATFIPEEYDMLREFFNLIVRKQGESIVLKKI